ncbi:N-acetylglucosamine-1-phosphodiester alpha-N-acetylglucosaminidase [Alosa sapidissima]|uniref:N-acetylglucosamine-1-phosphodiester alpha-N-acetylglucosaminidase n=1 Tax=Alosa sapidissima TaxID=34773 RepID=UPI001C0A5ECA|nr:N-acetylglucosamine-1-phosphodiester alpha-N-acetylglucosaminidase [Alosa sapidissima]
MAILLNCMYCYVWFSLLLCAVGSTEGVNTRYSLGDDLLLPYPAGSQHGSPHSHRHVRDCQPVVHGNVTHETWPAHNRSVSPVAESRVFVSAISSRWVSGHITVVSDPLRTVSVLEPGGQGGCQQRRRTQVSETARPKKCLYAQNGGFFDTKNFSCLGNVVSDGEMVQDSRGVQNAQFGIRKDGTLVFGYLSEEDVLERENPFVQLLSGVVWLLRNGEVYINESMKAECSKSQQTGSFGEFVNVLSARTAVGHDAEGRLVLFHIDGQTKTRGMNLWEVAIFLQSQGVINAINLDGGGSATYVVNGSLASYPSDHCELPMWRCPRNVSTVLCIHEPLCQPEDCSGHGTCVQGHCQCHPGWRDPDCARLVCQPPACGDHGVCTDGGCACDAGWIGSNCSQVCPMGFYGDGCNQTCRCANGGTCDPVHGSCSCLAGFHGDLCEQECPLGFYGLSCLMPCQCADMCPCDPATGSCNVTFQREQNHTMHRVGHCLAVGLWRDWKGEEDAHTPKPYFTEQTWLAIATVLASLLMASVAGNLIQACRKCSMRPSQARYSYTPLQELNGGLSRGEELGGGRGKRGGGGDFQLEDSDEDSS